MDPRWAAGEVIKAATARIMLLGLHDATELVASGNVGDASQLLLDIPGRLPCNEGKDGTRSPSSICSSRSAGTATSRCRMPRCRG